MTNKTFLESKHWLSGETNDNATLMSITPFYKVDFKDCLVKLGKFKLRQAKFTEGQEALSTTIKQSQNGKTKLFMPVINQ